MKEKLEQNGKPCCLNLITDADNRFLKGIEKQARKESMQEKIESQASQIDLAAVAESRGQDLANMTEEEKQSLIQEESKRRLEEEQSESEEDEIGALIQREEIEARKAEKEAAEKKLLDEEAEKERVEKEKREAAKLEQIRKNERDLLDKRSQPIRQYLMDYVVPHLTEGLINLCKEVPDDPTDYLATFLLNKADELDQQEAKKRDEEIRLRLAEKNGGHQ